MKTTDQIRTGHVYDEHYFRHYCGPIPYDRCRKEWLEFFAKIADEIVRQIRPRTVLDVGCAKGFLVEALRDRGVFAYGIDISEYAISEVREDIKPYCKVQSLLEPLEGRYDLIICIEVLEHLPKEEGRRAIANMCQHSWDIIFSSTPSDVTSETHQNVQPVEYWRQLFSEHGFVEDKSFNTSVIAPHAMRFRMDPTVLERQVRRGEVEVSLLLQKIRDQEETILELTNQIGKMQDTLGWQVLERCRWGLNRLAPPDTRRRKFVDLLGGAMRTLLTEDSQEWMRQGRRFLKRCIWGKKGFEIK